MAKASKLSQAISSAKKPKRSKASIEADKRIKALKPGTRKSASGEKYTENRANRSDQDLRRKFKTGGMAEKFDQVVGHALYYIDTKTDYNVKEKRDGSRKHDRGYIIYKDGKEIKTVNRVGVTEFAKEHGFDPSKFYSAGGVMDFSESIAEQLAKHYVGQGSQVFSSADMDDDGNYIISEETGGNGEEQSLVEIHFGSKFSDALKQIENDYDTFAKFAKELADKEGFTLEVLTSHEDETVTFLFTEVAGYAAGGSTENNMIPEAYNKSFRLKGNGRREYSLFQSHADSQLKQAAKQLFPEYTYEDHLRLAKEWKDKAQAAYHKYDLTVDKWSEKEFGRKLGVADYKVSGIYRDDFSDEAKKEIRAALKEYSHSRSIFYFHNAQLKAADKVVSETLEKGGKLEVPAIDESVNPNFTLLLNGEKMTLDDFLDKYDKVLTDEEVDRDYGSMVDKVKMLQPGDATTILGHITVIRPKEIGTTKSGKPVYDWSFPANNAGGREGWHQDWADVYKDFTQADHEDAVKLFSKEIDNDLAQYKEAYNSVTPDEWNDDNNEKGKTANDLVSYYSKQSNKHDVFASRHRKASKEIGAANQYRVIADMGGEKLVEYENLTKDAAEKTFRKLIKKKNAVIVEVDHPEFNKYGHLQGYKPVFFWSKKNGEEKFEKGGYIPKVELGDEGMFHGAESKVISIDNRSKNITVAELDDDGNVKEGKEKKVSKSFWAETVSKFPYTLDAIINYTAAGPDDSKLPKFLFNNKIMLIDNNGEKGRYDAVVRSFDPAFNNLSGLELSDKVYAVLDELLEKSTYEARLEDIIHFSTDDAFGKQATRKYQLGDKWRVDFDIAGMLTMGTKVNDKWPASKVKKLYESLVDMNYHSQARIAWNLFQLLQEGKKEEAAAVVKELNKSCKEELEESFAIGGLIIEDNNEGDADKDYQLENESDWTDDEVLYTVADDSGRVQRNQTESDVINLVNTVYHYDMADNDGDPVNNIQEAIKLLSENGYSVTPEKSEAATRDEVDGIVSKFSGKINSDEQVKAFFQALYDAGFIFHPDDDFSDYENVSPEQQQALNQIMDQCHEYCQAKGGDDYIYELGVEVQKKEWDKRGYNTPASEEPFAEGGTTSADSSWITKKGLYEKPPKITVKITEVFTYPNTGNKETWYDVFVNGSNWLGAKIEFHHKHKSFWINTHNAEIDDKIQYDHDTKKYKEFKELDAFKKAISEALVGCEYSESGFEKALVVSIYPAGSKKYAKGGSMHTPGQLYKVATADGYLNDRGYPVFYTRGEAQKKAKLFEGKVEIAHPEYAIIEEGDIMGVPFFFFDAKEQAESFNLNPDYKVEIKKLDKPGIYQTFGFQDGDKVTLTEAIFSEKYKSIPAVKKQMPLLLRHMNGVGEIVSVEGFGTIDVLFGEDMIKNMPAELFTKLDKFAKGGDTEIPPVVENPKTALEYARDIVFAQKRFDDLNKKIAAKKEEIAKNDKKKKVKSVAKRVEALNKGYQLDRELEQLETEEREKILGSIRAWDGYNNTRRANGDTISVYDLRMNGTNDEWLENFVKEEQLANPNAKGRGWGALTPGKKIKDIKSLKKGDLLLAYNNQFNSRNLLRVGDKRDAPHVSFEATYADPQNPKLRTSIKDDLVISDIDLISEDLYLPAE